MKETLAEPACEVPDGGQLNMSGNLWVAPPANYAYGGGAQTMSGYYGSRGADRPPARPAFAVTPAGPQASFPSWTYQRNLHPQVPGFVIKDHRGPPSAEYFPAAPIYTAPRPPLQPAQPPFGHLYSGNYNYNSNYNNNYPGYVNAPVPPNFGTHPLPQPLAVRPPALYTASFLCPPPPPPAPSYSYPPPPLPVSDNLHHLSHSNHLQHSQNRFNVMSSPPTSPVSPTDVAPAIHWQQELEKECERLQLAKPVYSLLSDRRGGRTAWSCKVLVNGENIAARYWYAGHHNAHEDAAEVALKRLQHSSPTGTTASLRHQYPSSPPGSTSYVLSTSSGPSSSVAGHPMRHHPAPQHFGHHPMQHYAAAGGRGGGGAFNVRF